MKTYLFYVFTIMLTGFGLLTLFLSISVIFDLFGIRAMEGNYVLFVVWSNFISSVLYLLAAYGFFQSKKWTIPLIIIAAIVLFIALIGLLIYINTGGIYKTKTIGALIFRIIVTLLFAAFAYFLNKKNYIYEK
ncbi:MAG: hypothetical protein GTN67_14775 [Hydrotalea flava]|uniref:hypothetical protein n=1 Tax=Hydrotalea TaxID=1004300 RepID=UPI000942E363|nr:MULTISPECIES: hypothetical protein [Hydrotalea]MBY0349045.1 hypothetical protein [Hydrotalea flava]NIM36541.1 hypothetical protein [Hydrotalea flava]NIM39400.1 hypothetical protein [Hydrotalea flava]NIN04589.1 hypothetical protein [Hydrotalea flava]NIN16261.1 hypothetical protein [Hydrotalea flava]